MKSFTMKLLFVVKLEVNVERDLTWVYFRYICRVLHNEGMIPAPLLSFISFVSCVSGDKWILFLLCRESPIKRHWIGICIIEAEVKGKAHQILSVPHYPPSNLDLWRRREGESLRAGRQAKDINLLITSEIIIPPGSHLAYAVQRKESSKVSRPSSPRDSGGNDRWH